MPDALYTHHVEHNVRIGYMFNLYKLDEEQNRWKRKRVYEEPVTERTYWNPAVATEFLVTGKQPLQPVTVSNQYVRAKTLRIYEYIRMSGWCCPNSTLHVSKTFPCLNHLAYTSPSSPVSKELSCWNRMKKKVQEWDP